MKTIDLALVSTENISIEKFMRLKKEGKLKNLKIRGIVAPSINGGNSKFGSIQIENQTPTYKAL
jgi:hypothetical protein